MPVKSCRTRHDFCPRRGLSYNPAKVSTPSNTSPDPTPNRVPWFIWTTILPARLVINAQFRIPYPFLPAISRGLGVPLEVESLLLTVRGLLGATCPLFGFLSDRVGRKPLMLAGLVMVIAGAALLVMGRSFGWALVASELVS